GDIIIDGDDIFGDGVNVAARLQTLAEPGGICVSKVVRDQVLDKLSFAFEDLGAQAVKNIARPVEAYRVNLGGEALQMPNQGRRRWQRLTRALGWRWLAAGVVAIGIAGIAFWTLPQLRKTASAPGPPASSIGIAPFAAPHGDVDASGFAEALTRSLMTGLPRKRPIGRVSVVSGGSAAAGASAMIDVRDLGRRLNVRYVLEGDVLRGRDGNTVNLRLVDAATGSQVWSERSTLQDSDVSAESSARLRNLIQRLRTTVLHTEQQRVVGQPPSNLSASELVLRAWAVWDKDPSLVGTREALKFADEALRLDPNLVPALTSRALLINFEGDVDPNQDRDRIGREQDELTARAVALDPTDPSAWIWRGVALEYLGRWDAALDANAMKIKLEPYEPDSYIARAWLMNMTARPAEALALVDRALALNPDGIGEAMRVACEAHLLAGGAEQAIATCEKAVSLDNDWINISFLTAAYANHGDMAKAAEAKTQMLKVVPGYTIAQLRAKRYSEHPDYQRLAEKYWYEGLRKAGIPEQ
ncbi:MAG TPA: hypothetical protein VEH02_01735, partial [Pseudolabrys sp.]|nr:hypothetical protein [Pseudolabrys sp.]